MSRDNSDLYSGITSASVPQTPRAAQKEADERAYHKLKPAAEVVLALIAKEQEAITDIRSLVIDRTTSEQEINTELLARKLYLGHLNSLESKIKQIIAKKVKS